MRRDCTFFIFLFTLALLRPGTGMGQATFDVSHFPILPRTGFVIQDISPYGRYAVLSDSENHVFVYDTYSETYLLVLAVTSPGDSTSLAGGNSIDCIRFNHSDSSLFICFSHDWYLLDLQYGKDTFSVRPFPIPRKADFEVYKIGFKESVCVSQDLILFQYFANEDDIRYWALDPDGYRPIKALNDSFNISKRLIGSRTGFLVNKAGNALYFFASKGQVSPVSVTLFAKKETGWQKKRALVLHFPPKPGVAKFPAIYLSRDEKRLVAVRQNWFNGNHTYEVAVRPLTGGRELLYEFGDSAQKTADSVFAGAYWGDGPRPDSLLLTAPNGKFGFVPARDYLCYNASDSTPFGEPVAGNHRTPYARTQDRYIPNMPAGRSVLVDLKAGFASYLNIPTTVGVLDRKFREPWDYRAFRLIQGTPFDLISEGKPALFSSAATIKCLAQHGGDTAVSLVIRWIPSMIDSVGYECGPGNLTLLIKGKKYRLNVRQVLDSIHKKHGGAPLDDLGRYGGLLMVRHVDLPYVFFVLAETGSINTLFSWDVVHHQLAAEHLSSLKGWPQYLEYTGPGDTVLFYYELRTRETATTLELYQYHLSHPGITLVDTLCFPGDLFHPPEDYMYNFVRQVQCSPELGICVISIPAWDGKVVLYDQKNKKWLPVIKSAGVVNDDPVPLDRADALLLPFYRLVKKECRLSANSRVNLNLLAEVYNNGCANEGFILDGKTQKATVVTDSILVNLDFAGDTLVREGAFYEWGAVQGYDADRNVLVAESSNTNEIYSVDRLNPAGRLLSIFVGDDIVRFRTPRGEYADFYTVENGDRSALDAFYNRPDRILAMINSPDARYNFLYHKVVELRLQKIHQAPTIASPDSAIYDIPGRGIPPEVELRGNPPLNKIYFDSRDLALSFLVRKRRFPVDRLNIWINGVPQYGPNGEPITVADSLQLTRKIQLSAGRNAIQVAVRDTSLVWSEKATYVCHRLSREKSASRIFFFGIGMSQYQDSSRWLNTSAKDIVDVGKAIAAVGLAPDPSIDSLINVQDDFKTRFRDIKTKLMQTGVDDKIILMLSGHGLLSNKNLTWYFAGYRTNFSRPDTATALTYDDINWLFDGVPARNRLVIIDACHAGQSFFDYRHDSAIAMEAPPSGRNATGKAKDGSGRHAPGEGLPFKIVDGFSRFEPADDFVPLDYQAFEIITQAFPDYTQNGSTVITASRGEQLAEEDRDNGLLTKAILVCLRQAARGSLTVNRLIGSINAQFASESGQTPSLKSYNPNNDWLLW